jgi:hypothetical protein
VSRGRHGRTLAPSGSEPLNREQALARFSRLEGRSVTLGFVAFGPIVPAETPEQLAEAVGRAMVTETGRGWSS